MELTHIAARDGRLSSFLKEELKMSTGLINRLKWDERILVNNQPQHTDFSVKIGDNIPVLLDESPPEYPAEEGKLTVLYEDDHLLDSLSFDLSKLFLHYNFHLWKLIYHY